MEWRGRLERRLTNESLQSNRRFVLRLWLFAGGGVAFVVTLMVTVVLTADDFTVWLAAAFLPTLAVLIFGLRWWGARRFEKALQQPRPTAFLRFVQQGASAAVPHAAQMAAGQSALVSVLYGEVEQAERFLDSVTWNAAPAIVEAQASAARALIAYVRGDAREGLGWAGKAREEARVGSGLPGGAATERAFNVYVALGTVLYQEETEETIQDLTDGFERLPLLPRVVAAWGLALVAAQRGDRARFEELRGFIATRTPHFTPIFASLDAA